MSLKGVGPSQHQEDLGLLPPFTTPICNLVSLLLPKEAPSIWSNFADRTLLSEPVGLEGTWGWDGEENGSFKVLNTQTAII